MTVSNRVEINVETGEITYIPVDDAWIIANKPDRISLVENTGTVSVQLLNPLGVVKQAQVQTTLTIKFLYADNSVEEETYPLETDANGQETIVLPAWSGDLQKITLYTIEPDSNILEVTNAN